MFYLGSVLFMSLNFQKWGQALQKSNKQFFAVQATRLILGLVLVFLTTYFGLVDQTFEAYFFFVVSQAAIVQLIDFIFNKDSKLKGKFVALVFSSVVLTSLVYFTLIYPMTITKDLYSLVNTKTEEGQQEALDLHMIPVVSRESASYKGEKLVGEMKNPTFYTVGKYDISKVGEELVWVAPIEFSGFFKANTAKTTPGYIKVSAVDPNKPAELVQEYNMVYVPSNYFSNNLHRHVRNQFPDIIIMEESLELDDNGKPYYAVSYGHYNNIRRGLIVDGVILVDTETGESKKYLVKDVPAFVDQVYPMDIAWDYNTYFGAYAQGFWNSITSQVGMHVPTEFSGGDALTATFDKNGTMLYVTDHTKPDSSSNSMVGYSTFDARTGQLTYFEGSNGMLTGNAAVAAVEKETVQKQLIGVNPVLYNLYNEQSFVISMIDSTRNFRGVGVVHAETGKVVFAETKEIAFKQYKNLLTKLSKNGNAAPTDEASLKSVTGIVKRINHVKEGDVEVFYILLQDDKKIYSASTEVSPFLVLTNDGDTVTLQILDTDEQIVPIQVFENTTLK